jgi:flavodoxin
MVDMSEIGFVKKTALVAFDTLFGNTERIAQALGTGLRKYGVVVDCVNVRRVDLDLISQYDLIAIGGPTHHLSASQPMMDFLEDLGATGFADSYGFAFDTRIDYFYAGSASKYIEEKLGRLGLRILRPRGSAIVRGLDGGVVQTGEAVLIEGQERLFEDIGIQLGAYINEESVVGNPQGPHHVTGTRVSQLC